ncbi:uncharacterized protein SPAPADRAFT_60379 [Spathaspora passalidarum NRRL Y-27907]|uniref:Uncharacterized protein n=1 Tax=Spathaspora passalidarum (strain NRRL Y-27907 / 11-Y1) TaxID=619300 RepID=G3AL20_SPAPN|nr:uncharacterized protein SPAPADRAFT_60379 [Spathaspora passalidarum NRRL Y-27907]EGW33063.1 hypothetical protein SPAPADRAFT_60379 [Spathaspora passalidarum NRRL Y-27907]
MEPSGTDRKSRLAELRRKRNQAQAGITEQHTESKPDVPQPQSIRVKSESELTITEAPTLQLPNGETVEAVSQRIQDEIFHRAQYAASAIVDQDVGEDGSSPPPQKISYTQDLKKDLKSYYHKANIRTERAINRIISDKYQQ